jgi:tetratricopeptide (TPR) repeat protein
MEMSYFEEEGEYSAARQVSLEMLDLLKENRSVYRKQRLGITFLNLCLYDVYLGSFSQAVSNARSAVKFFPVNSVNYFIGKEQEFLAAFYGNISEFARMALTELQKAGKKEHGNFRVDKYNYYHTCLLFKEGRHKEALRELSTHHDISRDKTGWEISLRVLAIMSNIELQRFDEAALLVENLRKHAERNKKGKMEISQRDTHIVRILVDLSRKGFMFNTLHERTLLNLGRLSGSDKKLRWQPFGAELIPFHEWMIAKVPVKSGAVFASREKKQTGKKKFVLAEMQKN